MAKNGISRFRYAGIFLLLVSCHAKTDVRQSMCAIPGGSFYGGAEPGDTLAKPWEGKWKKKTVQDFYIDSTEVSVEAYAAFLTETGYTSNAPEKGGMVVDAFQPGRLEWRMEPTAQPLTPLGAEKIYDKQLPVTQVSQADADAYCRWKNKRLPTEAELEYILRKAPVASPNVFEGTFPCCPVNGKTANLPMAVDEGIPNAWGLYHTAGNVWEWTSDTVADANGTFGIAKGGSLYCHASYCAGYRASARNLVESTARYAHMGFRCACDEK